MRSIVIWVGAVVFVIGAGVFFIEREYISSDKNARIRLEKGKLQLERFDEDGLRSGIDELTTVVAQYPDSVYARQARYHLAEAYERLGMRDVALGKYKKLLTMPLTDELKAQVKFKVAKLQVLRNYSDEGMNQLLHLLNTTADKNLRSEIYLEIAKYYHRKDLKKDALRNFQNALTENPESREARAALGLGDADYQNSVALHGILDKTGSSQTQEQKPDAVKPATTEKEKQVVVNPQFAAKLAEGIQAFSRSDYRNAVRLLTPIANSTAKESEDALYYLGNAYLKLKEYRNAVHFLNKAVSNTYRERDEAAFIKKGEALYLNNQFERALKVFNFVRTHYTKGKYAQIAADWEGETKRMLGEKYGDEKSIPMANDDLVDDDDDLWESSSNEDALSPQPKYNSRRDDRREEITLDDDVTP
ncbi:MAG TPA: tetratricopeptide repeat protein [Turneriella sp.]|nr:tetratricopeptide repeat protein [Turneriella sp.]